MEVKKRLQVTIPLFTPSGKVLVSMKIVYDDKEIITDPTSEISLTYNGNEYKGYGVDYLWTDALADLETKLPEDITIACCMTCRHGNMCPYGNVENQLFCTKDLEINSKEDVCTLFEHANPFEERAVASFDCCDEFVCQSEDYYTYNDYLCEQKKKRRKQ